jgi:hypothetical protein
MTSSAYTYRSGVSNDVQCTNCVNTTKVADDAVTFEKYNCVNISVTGTSIGGYARDFNTSGICYKPYGCTIRVSYYPAGIVFGSWKSAAWGYVGVGGSSWASMVLQGNGNFRTHAGTFANGTSETIIEDNSSTCVVWDDGVVSPNNFSVSSGSSNTTTCNYWFCD